MNWITLKMRPTQFDSAKNHPGRSREFWASVKQTKEVITYLVGEKNDPKTDA